MVIRELNKLDLPFLLEIRNHESTRVNLEDDSIFDIDQCIKWFKTLTSPWFIIEVDNKPVGYIRVKGDLIGVDIHMDFRKKGYAKQAFKEYLKDKEHAALWVFNDNFAKELYLQLGFFETGNIKDIRGKSYIEMNYTKSPDCKVAKVLAFYFGWRRLYPHNKEGVIDLFKTQIKTHQTLNPGVNMDLIIVNHDTQDQDVYDLLNEYDGQDVSTGKIKVIHRPRISSDLSFGSYKYAFHLLKNEYDYWFFSEDDILPLTNGVVPELIDILNSSEDIGFVGALRYPGAPHCYTLEDGYIISHDHVHGGVGLTSTAKMKKVAEIVPIYLQTPNILNEEIKNKIENDYLGENTFEIGFTQDFINAGFKLKAKNSLDNFSHIREEIKL